jgi:CheY-like chemotaxis protein
MPRQQSQPLATPPRLILIAAGDADTRALYRAVLDNRYAVVECDDGAEALGKAICDRPDLIIAESRLSRIDGMNLCRLLRTDPATRSAPIILISNTENPAESVRAKNAGADRTLAKPFTPDTLATAVREVCEQPRSSATPQWQSAPADAEPPPQPRLVRRARSRTVRREHTTTPPLPPPALHCPTCQGMLVYEHSQTGGVNERSLEQWDYFRCSSCGPYQYRQRTRKLRAAL